nr:hypothetical protein [Nonomuraea lactucae]
MRQRIADFQSEWMRRIVKLIDRARSAGDVAAEEDPAQLAFELNSMLALANSTYVMFADPAVFDRARAGIGQRLRLARHGPTTECRGLLPISTYTSGGYLPQALTSGA